MTSLPNVVTSLGAVKAHVRKVAEEIAAKWPLYFIWGYAAKKGEHGKGLALDFMTYELGGGVDKPGPTRDQVGNEIADYVWRNRHRLGVWYVIWRQRIISVNNNDYGPAGKWNKMPDRGDPTANHMDHVHVSFETKHEYYPPEDIDVALTDAEITKIATKVVDLLKNAKLDPGQFAERIGGYTKDQKVSVGGVWVGADAWGRNADRKITALASAIDKFADSLPLSIRTAVREALKDAK